MGRAERIAAGSIAAGLAVLALKGTAWALTGSAALFSDALESVVNVAAAALALGALHLAAKPADDNHTYGHDKAEFFSAVIEGVFVVVAAIVILFEAWTTYRNPRPIELPFAGLAVNLVATAINFGWSRHLVFTGRALRSPALLADAAHLRADVATSIGITAGVALAVTTGALILDPILAALTAAHVLWSGMRMVRGSVGGLMDEAPAPLVVARIRRLVAEHAEGALEAHDLRTRSAGRLTYLEFHLVVPGSMTVAQAHEICDRVEAALKSEMADMVITIHVEPEAKAKHQGVLVL